AKKTKTPIQDTLSPVQEKLLEAAKNYLGAKELVINNKRFNLDCIGTVSAFYFYAGIDLTQDFAKYSGDGVQRLYKTLEAKKLLYKTDAPVPGD
ncbi:hypothetical protein LZP69_16380, partial [Shewanella sp. AS1]|uniref:hypothetical protein n=1 Tax=Shewanella sp. AS1 TaxID=2907626 RepID=UPI001F22BADF